MENKLFPSLNQIEPEDDKIIQKPLFTTIEYTLDTIVDKIINIDNLDKDEIKGIIFRQHNLILNYDLFLSSKQTRSYALSLFSNVKFLEIFYSVIGLLKLSEHEIMCINKLAYDYYILPNKDTTVSDMLLTICNSVNSLEVIKLSSMLGMNNARILSMISKSTFRLEKRIHRINNFIVKCDLKLSAQNIIDIYFILYDRFTYPIIYSMLETKPDNLTLEQSLKFDTISSVIVTILNNLPSEKMNKVLYDYAFTLKHTYKDNTKVRFSMKSIPDQRIQSVIKEIEADSIDRLCVP